MSTATSDFGTSRKCGGTVLTAAYCAKADAGCADVRRYGNIKRTSKQTRHRQMAFPMTSAGASRL